MSPNKQEPVAESLYQLLGAPLHALIEAEYQSANATVAFIEQVGFDPPEQGSSKPPQRDMGKLRTISFQQEQRTAEGKAATYTVEVPLLSILPIPALQIKEAELEFLVKIVAMGPPGKQTSPKAIGRKSKEETLPGESPLVPLPGPRVDMKAMLGRGLPQAPLAASSALDMQMHIKIKVAQADLPAGLGRLFNLMEQSISSTRVEEE